MDFSWTDEQRQLRETITRFGEKELNTHLRQLDRDKAFNLAGWKKCGEMGIHGLPIPKQYGGGGADVLTTICALEGLGRGCRDHGLIFSINAHLWGCEIPILTFGTEEQKATYLPKLCTGEFIGGHAMTEPDSGSDAYSLKTTAERRGDRYLLNGRKLFVTNAPLADLMVVFASIDRRKGAYGVTGFLVDKNAPGLSVGPQSDKMGLRTSPMSEIILENCEVPVERRLGKEGAGVAIFGHSMEWERSCILASAVGAMERQLESCIRYARQRQQFGQPIGKFQSVANKIVDMKIRLDTARSLLYQAGWLKTIGRSAFMEAAMAKLYISECWVQSCLDAIQIHGAYGYMTESEVERDLRDALGSRLYSGTSEIQRQIIAQFMGL
ncbi:MAG TPA: acyl-CoA dehydrogenase family protein [Alphaproteobacteria bacterium]|nr:acyl-CoA dehydrogenase family protein [Alphaproteobacteria bacterium]